MRRSTSYLLALVIAGAFVGCGKNEGGSEQDNSDNDQSYIIKQPETQAEREAAEAAKSPEDQLKLLKKQVKKARANLDCPAKIEGKRAEGAPVDDIQGVRLGITYNEAVNSVLCSNEMLTLLSDTPNGYRVNHFGLGESMRDGFKANLPIVIDYGNEHNNYKQTYSSDVITDWEVTTVGLPKQEYVILIMRTESYRNDKKPSLSAVEKALIDKYGNPTKRQDRSDELGLSWAYDTLGRPVVETSPLFGECNDTYPSSELKENCGLVITAIVSRESTNQALARSLKVIVKDGANGNALFQQTEQKYREMDEAKRAKELKDAEKNSTAPQL